MTRMLVTITLLITLALSAFAAEPPKDPILRIETDMHSAPITGIATDSANRVVATASLDKTIKIWETDTGELIRTIHPPVGTEQEGVLNALAMSPDGKSIATGGVTGKEWNKSFSVYIFDTQSGAMSGHIDGLATSVIRLVYSPDGSRLAVGNYGSVSVFNTSTLKNIWFDKTLKVNCLGLDFDKNGNLVAGSNSGDLKMYRPDGTLIYELQTDRKGLQNIKFSPDGSLFALVYGGFHGNAPVEVRNALNGTPAFVLTPGWFLSVAWSPDGKYIMAAGSAKDKDAKCVILKWSVPWRRLDERIVLPTKHSIYKLLTLNNGSMVFASREGGFGFVSSAGGNSTGISSGESRVAYFKAIATADFTKNHDKFKITPDASAVQFSYEQYGQAVAFFDLKKRHLITVNLPEMELISPRLTANGIDVKNWDDNDQQPRLNRKPLADHGRAHNHSYSIRHDDAGLVFGSRSNLRYYSKTGKQQWVRKITSDAWDVVISADDRTLVVAHGDSTIRWYRLKDGVELYALFLHPDKKRWVLWTPEGFFDHSPGGEDLLGWHLNQGKNKEALFFPASRLYKEFYRPDLLLASIEGKDISAYAKAIEINKHLSQVTIPPIVRFLTKSGSIDNYDIPIRAQLCDTGGGIGDVTLFLNGMPVAVETGGRGLKIVENKQDGQCSTFERTITLTPGVNSIQLMAYNKDNTIESHRDTIEINHAVKAVQPELYVLTVAVNAYRDGDLRLKHALPDADALAELAQEKGKLLFGKVHINTLRDGNVTKEGLAQTFSRIGGKMRREDVFLLFVAGHGITDEREGAYYFLPADFSYTGDDAVQKLGVSMTDFRNMLANIQAMKSLILLDTCNSGSFAEAIASRGMVEKTAITKLSRAVGRATIVASSKNQVALEGYEGHGAFTWTILEGMKGKAADFGGKITINNLATFIEEELPKLTYKKWGYEQVPQKSLQGMDFPIGVK